MEERPFERLELLYGQQALEKLQNSRVAVFGIGGVGSYVTEALARSGIGALDLIDHDRVSVSNLNRQIIALHSSLGRYKTDVAEERVRDINPHCAVRKYSVFFLPDTADQFDFREWDYVVDAVDTVTAKLLLAEKAQAASVPVLSVMGTGNKIHPELLELARLSETSVCPLARIMRKECRKRGIHDMKVVYSREDPLTPHQKLTSDTETTAADGRTEPARVKPIPGSSAFVPAVAGLLAASAVVNDLTAGLRE